MFYYYGRKKQIAKYYPKPNYDTIIEPFAGSAAYSLYKDNWKKKVILIEKDEKVYDIWRWLIHDASENDILNLPDLKVGEKSSEFLHIVHAATKMAFHFKTIKVTSVLERNWEISKRVFGENLFKIKHWEILNKDYSESPNIKATWFIDPPYKGDAGLGYRHSSKLLDYGKLAEWILDRQGEIICCEGKEGDYLPFKPLIELTGIAGKVSKEVIYYRTDKNLQLDLFE
ncbi:DNA adenine methylase [Chryseobacterium sp.]|uniref:DNA adenine methylase n=1 Tax=Chryseobacterium sp. TaxID=1871047 RepID=UPI00289844C9|nr:DNA adenine methylase [Chryseobacterium sp.]